MITPEPLHLVHLVTVARLRFLTGCTVGAGGGATTVVVICPTGET